MYCKIWQESKLNLRWPYYNYVSVFNDEYTVVYESLIEIKIGVTDSDEWYWYHHAYKSFSIVTLKKMKNSKGNYHNNTWYFVLVGV